MSDIPYDFNDILNNRNDKSFNEMLNREWGKLIKQAMEETPTVEELIKMLGNIEGKTEDEMAKIINERSAKTMTVADLKAMLKNMPDEAEITADENVIEKVTADIDLNGNIERVDLVLK